MRLRSIFFGSLLFLSLVHYCAAQSPTGTISGIVTDPTGSTIAGAEVVVVNDATRVQFSGKTNVEGIYVIANLPPGNYRVQVAKVGFKTIIKPDIVLNVQDALAINFALPLGAMSEIVTIQGGTPLVNTESAAVSTVVDRQFVENIPLNGRSFQSLIQLSPGVVLTKTDSTNSGQFSVNGQRADANYFTVDGVSANIGVGGGTQIGQSEALPGFSVAGGTNNLVSVDAMQEFRIQTSTYAPEFGRSPGAQVQIATRSGTNQFHGTVFDYLRNDALDANNWFNGFTNIPPLPKAKDRQNDFGGVFGGPVRKDRTFFFISYEGLRLQQPLTATTQVPSLVARQNAVPQMQPFLNSYPLPNGPDGTNGFAQFSASFSNPSTLNATSVRIDESITSKIIVFARYNYAPSDTVQRGGSFGSASLNTLGVTDLKTQTLTLGASWLISSRTSNDLRFNWSANKVDNFNMADSFGGAVRLTDALAFPSFTSFAKGAFTMLLIGGIGTTAQLGNNASTDQRQLNIVDNLSVVVGSHQLKLGFDYRRLYPIYEPLDYNQLAIFNGAAGAGTGKLFSGIILGFAGAHYPIFNNYSTYAQDTWKATRNLTLTYGLRWDVNPAPYDRNGKQFTVTGLNNPASLALAPQGQELWKTTYGDVAPRFGMAYQLVQRSGLATVLRGGIGAFYDLGYGLAAEALGNSWPFTATKALANGTAFPLDASSAAPPPINTVPSPGAPATNFFVAVPNLRLPRTYEWNVAVEQSVGAEQSVTVSYVGALGRDLLRQDILSHPNPNFGNVFVTRNTASSNYEAMQIEYRRRLSHRVQALASYTWSHSLDDASNDASRDVPAGEINLDQERGPSDFDIRHSFSGALTFDLPAPAIRPIAKLILRDWSLDGIYRARSASPVNVITGTDVFGLGTITANSRPDRVPGVPLYIFSSAFPGGKEFNPAAFSNIAAGAGRQGTLGRNALRGFPLSQLDFTVRRKVNLTERLSLQFRAEFFNLLNQPNFGDPVNNLSSSLFGHSTQMLASSLGTGGINGGFSPLYQVGGPRSIQLALKLEF